MSGSDLVLKARRLIDGTGAQPLDDAAVLVSGTSIKGVFQGAVPEGLMSSDTQVLEFPEGTLLPGLIDTHVHLNLPGDGTPYLDTVAEPDGVLVATSAHNARVALESGVTTLRDTGGRGSTTFELRRALSMGWGVGARLVLCGQPITISGGHTWHFGGEADGIEGVRRKAREMVRLGADFIKVMGTGGGTPGTMSWLPSFSREEMAAVAGEAHRLGRRITVHCLCRESIEFALDAGVDQIEHAGFILDAAGTQKFDPATAEKIAAAKVVVTGTLSVGEYVINAMLAKERRSIEEQRMLDRWQVMFADNLDQFAGLRRAGVQFVAGTDAGWRFTPFDSLPDEMRLMQQGGLTALETIVAATSRAAWALGIDAVAGAVREGLEADLLVVDGNPLDDLRVLKSPRFVMQAGQVRLGDTRTARGAMAGRV